MHLVTLVIQDSHAAPPVFFNASDPNRRQGLNKQATNAIPAPAIARAKATLMPAIYATRIPGTWAASKTDRSSVAPVATTVAASTPGAAVGSLRIIVFTKADCAAETKKAPPSVW